MAGLSQDQTEMQARIQKSALIWGAVVGVIAGLLALWLLGGQGAGVRYGGALVVALIAGFLVHRASYGSQAKAARCAACGAAFSRSRTDRQEALKSSAPKEERELQADQSTKVTTWTEERYDVTDTYTCAKCRDATTNNYQTTRRRDETSRIEPAKPAKKSTVKAGGWEKTQPGVEDKVEDSAAPAPSKRVAAGKTGEGSPAAPPKRKAASAKPDGGAAKGQASGGKSGRKGSSR